jgi:peptidoglycan/LPS O-acetylase OafA/YrhL
MKPENPNRQYYPVLDGIRGFAILLVVFYHNFGFINYFFFGWLGVDLFFVLSGFLITDILLKTFGNKNYLRNFYTRRVLRIFPLYYLSLVIFLLILSRVRDIPIDLSYYTQHQWWLWTYLQNWLYIFKPTNSTNALHHFWSLAVEEQFYLLWPLAILILKKPKYLLILMGILLFLVMIFRFFIWTFRIEDLAYFNLYTFSRIDGICIGCMLSLIQRINPEFLKKFTPAIVLAMAAVNFIFYFFNRLYHFTFPYLAIVGYTTFAMLFALLINEAVIQETRIINFIFNNRLLKFFGKISYGLYVFHWPIFIMVNPYMQEWAGKYASAQYAQIISSVVATLIAIVISVLSFRYFESIFLNLKNRLS